MDEETISLAEWVEAIQDVASLEKDLRETSNPQKQQILVKARREAVERVLAIRFLTGASTDRVEAILDTESWAATYYEDLSKENEDDLGRTYPQVRDLLREPEESPSDSGELSSWYSGASPLGETR